jgi:hypothetical protein
MGATERSLPVTGTRAETRAEAAYFLNMTEVIHYGG